MSTDWGTTASTSSFGELDDPFQDQGPIRKIPRLFPLVSVCSAFVGFVLAVLHTSLFGLFRGLGLPIGILGYLLCLIVPVFAFFLLEAQKIRMQKQYRSRFDAYHASQVSEMQKRITIVGVALSLMPIWYVAGAVGEWFQR